MYFKIIKIIKFFYDLKEKMNNYNFKENLNVFERFICTKGTPFNKISLSTIGGPTRYGIIFLLLIVITACIMNIIANFEIYNKPDQEQNISNAYCIALLVFNFIVLVLSLVLGFYVIKSFWTDSEKDKLVKGALREAEGKGAKEGAAIGVAAAIDTIINNVPPAIAAAAASQVKRDGGSDVEATSAGRTLAATAAAAINQAVSGATAAAITAAVSSASNESLEADATASVSAMPSALGSAMPSALGSAMPSALGILTTKAQFQALGLPPPGARGPSVTFQVSE
jgi:hypothetical protein